jgi:hypothetical protein
MPIEMRISASDTPIFSRNSRATLECVIEAGCEISVSGLPNFMISRWSSSPGASFSSFSIGAICAHRAAEVDVNRTLRIAALDVAVGRIGFERVVAETTGRPALAT